MNQRDRNEKLIIQIYELVAAPGKVECIACTRFSDRHFWHGGYDKAKYPLAEAAKPHADLEAGRTTGSVLLVP